MSARCLIAPRISLLCPTYGRPDGAVAMEVSAIDTCCGPIEVLFGCDNDEQAEAINARRKASEIIDILTVDPAIAGKVSKIWNWLVPYSCGDVLMLANDDIRFHTAGWDAQVYDAFSSFPGRLGMVWCDDGINGPNHAAFPFVTRQWVDVVGHFTPGIFEFGFNDTWVYDIAKRAGRLKYLPEILIEHRHFSVGKSAFDDTYARQRRDGRWRRDRDLFESTADRRELAARKIVLQAGNG